jgi:hypothetical protein
VVPTGDVAILITWGGGGVCGAGVCAAVGVVSTGVGVGVGVVSGVGVGAGLVSIGEKECVRVLDRINFSMMDLL